MAAGMHSRDARGPEAIRIYAIGDIHGRLDLLRQLHERIAKEIARDRIVDWRIVHLGDYTDRGPESRGVLDFLIAASGSDPRILALAGNHDTGFLDFLADPDPESVFIRFGGIETARSYGVTLDTGRGESIDAFHRNLVHAVPQAHIDFIRSRGFSVVFGDFFFCHAGVRPDVALDRQDREDLIWIRDGFLDYDGLLPKVVVHGHTIVPEPEIRPNRIDIDTGAYRTGILTAIVIDGRRMRFLAT